MQKNILIIEDEKSIQNVLKAFLEESGYQITLADDGIEGIAAFHKTKYDLVLLDIMMPKLDGYTVCEMIRKESSTPVILLTALDDEESQMKGFDLLADDYITKPFSMPLVMRRIEAVLRRTQNGQEVMLASYKYTLTDGYVEQIDQFVTELEGSSIDDATQKIHEFYINNNASAVLWRCDTKRSDEVGVRTCI